MNRRSDKKAEEADPSKPVVIPAKEDTDALRSDKRKKPRLDVCDKIVSLAQKGPANFTQLQLLLQEHGAAPHHYAQLRQALEEKCNLQTLDLE